MVSNGLTVVGRSTKGALQAMPCGLLALGLAALLSGCALPHRLVSADDNSPSACVRADIVAFEQAYVLNRFGAYVPAGLMYALRADVVPIAPEQGLVPGNVMLRQDKRPRPLVLRVNQGECLDVVLENMLSPNWAEEGRPVPRVPAHVEAAPGAPSSRELVRASSMSIDAPATRAASFHVTGLELMHIDSQQCPLGAACGGDGSNVGQTLLGALVFHPDTPQAERARFTKGSLAMPGQRVMTRWLAAKEGTYFAYSTAAPVGGEGDGGQIGLGLFAAVNVEPAGSLWLRSQVTHAQMLKLRQGTPAAEHPGAQLRYFEEEEINGHRRPILRMLDAQRRIVHSDLNAIIVLPQGDKAPAPSPAPSDGLCGVIAGQHMAGAPCAQQSFREFTVVLHDEIHAKQAFAELEDENNPMHYVKDGMGVNYGASSMGSLAMSTPLQRGLGVAKDCPECRAEEFFLSSWANGDPALVLKYDTRGKQPVGARYPDDPSNVHHSYLGDPVRFRNLHAGPKETHVFHLHAHQWVADGADDNSSYLDSQTISPGATFSYGIMFGGSGNRNFAPGDSIFHCHLYPHFAQGMWELWRVHDSFEDGNAQALYNPNRPAGPDNRPEWRRLPDAEVPLGTESPAVVPIPGLALAPVPSAQFAGYPFYIPGQAGHRPPQPVLDMDVAASAAPALESSAYRDEPDAALIVNGGLPRHLVHSGTLKKARDDHHVREEALKKGGEVARLIARRVDSQNDAAVGTLAAEWDALRIVALPHTGTVQERAAMDFHEGKLVLGAALPASQPVGPGLPNPQDEMHREVVAGYATRRAATIPDLQGASSEPPVFRVNGRGRKPGAPFADPCPAEAPKRHYRAAFIQTELTYNKHGWFDPQGRIVILEDDIKDTINADTRTRPPEPLFFRANSGDCIDFKSSNFVPSALNADDFQVYTPTDTIGQHIHLVKFDVTSSDGSGNGWNYEDATFSPDEVRERVLAHNRSLRLTPVGTTPLPRPEPGRDVLDKPLFLRAHPLFLPKGDIYEAAQRDPAKFGALLKQGTCPAQDGLDDLAYAQLLNKEHPLCGAQRTTQRWWADPIINAAGKDNTLRTVFTHDHMGPSSHQQHGLYAALVIEPANSVWTRLDYKPNASDLTQAGAQQAAQGSLRCELPSGQGGRSALCDSMLGGANLAAPTRQALRREQGHVLSSIEPRDPLVLRGDGGPTAAMANIFAPECVSDGDSQPADIQPRQGLNRDTPQAKPLGCLESADVSRRNEQTRREFMLAFADFGVAYNTALEPINPEPLGDASGLRDTSAIRFGRRHVAAALARPLAISSEDPGSQYINYRHEPLALRISEAQPMDPAQSGSDPEAALGGFRYSQSRQRAKLDGSPCGATDIDCLGDMANAFSTQVHAVRDDRLAKQGLTANVSRRTRQTLENLGQGTQLSNALASVEKWRRRFNCSLYGTQPMPDTGECQGIQRPEPWREFGDPATPILPAYEGERAQLRLVQGAQEAQHVFVMNGLRWPKQVGSPARGYTHAQPIGISEHFEFDVRVNSFGQGNTTDYLYRGSSIDQLWDGMWGVLRAFPQTKPVAALKPLTDQPEALRAGNVTSQAACQKDLTLGSRWLQRTQFDVSAVRACELYGSCEGAVRGIQYNSRLQLQDERAVVYVLNFEGKPGPAAQAVLAQPNSSILTRLVSQFRDEGRPLEPLVLRAAAGDCIEVKLRNHLPAGAAQVKTHETARYNNFLPMITDGFNINDFAMSNAVSLSVPQLAQNPVDADGSNVGRNSISFGADSENPNDRLRRGSLVEACPKSEPNLPQCARTVVWWAGDYGASFAPVEHGALPLSSFGDAIKHPAHGLVGALVIGPKATQVCTNDRFAFGPDGQPLKYRSLLSAEICTADGQRHHVEHVLVIQDGVSASTGGLPAANLSGAEEPDDYGVKAINYRSDPLWGRRGGDASAGFSDRNEQDYSEVLSSAPGALPGTCAAGVQALPGRAGKQPCDPEAPVFEVRAGETLRLHFVHPGGHTRQQGLAVAGHAWDPMRANQPGPNGQPLPPSSIRQGVFNGFGPMMGATLEMTAGGTCQVPKDYLIRSQASFLFDGGLWGILRVQPGQLGRLPPECLGTRSLVQR